MAIISAVLTQATAQAQTVKSTDRISIDYGFVTQHYQTTWSDPTPAGVARGMPPSALRSAMIVTATMRMDLPCLQMLPSTRTQPE